MAQSWLMAGFGTGYSISEALSASMPLQVDASNRIRPLLKHHRDGSRTDV